MASRPQVTEGLGEKSQFKELKLELKSHKGAEFETDLNIFTIELKTGEDVRSIVNLFHYDANGKEEEEIKTAVFVQCKERSIKYKVAVNKTGWYKLNIFATPISNKSNSLPCVYTYLFHVNKVSQRAQPYPKQFADWKKDYYLRQPKYFDTAQDLSKVKFEVNVPDAKKVAVKVGDEWTHMEKKGGGKWTGDVNLSHHVQQAQKSSCAGPLVSLNACTGADESSYCTLLHYQL